MSDVDGAKCRVGVDINGHQNGGEDQEYLHLFADSEPDDHQRNQCKRGDRSFHLDNAIDESLTGSRQSR